MTRQGPLAKISQPRLFGVVPRERLFALLDENKGRPLIWIVAPPGAGKTTLVASYLEARERPTVWYQMDPGDADPAALFLYLSHAAANLRKHDEPPLPRFVPEHLSDLTGFARLFFRAFFAQLPIGVVLTLDNYQEIPDRAPLHEILHHCILEVPRESSVIAISRVDAPVSLIGVSASGAMTTIGWDKLQLTLDEVRAVCLKRDVTDEWLLQTLHQQSHGWAAGITLMLERLGHFDGRSRELPPDTRESVFDYFARLIFEQFPEPTQTILLSIAFLPHVTPTLAVDLSGRGEAPALLEELSRKRLFTDRRPGLEHVYQFHALFLDFLKRRASESLTATELARLINRSASALEDAGESIGALQLWQAAQNWEEAIRLTLSEANRLLNSGRRETLVQAIYAIPNVSRDRQPWLAYWLGRAHLQIDPSEGIRVLERALDLFRRTDDQRGCIECLAALLGGAFAGFGALDAMGRWLDQLLLEIERSPAFASTDAELRIWGVVCMTLYHVMPWHPLTVPAFRRVEELLPHCTDPSVALTAATGAVVVSTFFEDFDRGERIAASTEPLALRSAAGPSEAAWWFAQVGYLKFVQARHEEAIEYLTKGCQIAASNGLREVLQAIMLWRFTVEVRLLGWPVANATLAEVERMPRSSRPMVVAMLCLFQARRAWDRGQREEAAKLASLSDQAAMRAGSRLEEVVFGITNAELLLGAHQLDSARSLLSRCRLLIERAPVFDSFRACQLFVEAWQATVEGDGVRTLALLAESLRLAREGNRRYYLRLLWCSTPPLFGLALKEGVETNLVQDLIRMFRLKPPRGAPDLWPWPIRIRTLGRFEVLVNEEPLEFSRKVPKKTLALLKVLVAYGGQEVSEQSLCDALWGDEEADAARQALGITVVRLRKLLGVNDAVSQQGGKISLDRTQCWVDAWRFEERIGQSNEPGAVSKPLALYKGAFLPEDEGEPWSVPVRERLRGKFIHLLATHGHSLEAGGDTAGAIELYLLGVDADPIVEMFYQGLMRCYQTLDRHTEAISAYRRLRHTLSVVLGVAPSPESQNLYRTIMDACAERIDEKEHRSVIALAATSQSLRHRSRPAKRAG